MPQSCVTVRGTLIGDGGLLEMKAWWGMTSCPTPQDYPHFFFFHFRWGVYRLSKSDKLISLCFIHDCNYNKHFKYELIPVLLTPQGLILGSILVPLRVTLAALFFLIIWPLARLRLAGLSKEERARPVTGWRRWLFHPIVWLLSRAVFFSLGFLWVEVKGRRADLKEAPVLVVAPHSGFLDMLVLCPAQLATVVSRSENTSLPVIGGKKAALSVTLMHSGLKHSTFCSWFLLYILRHLPTQSGNILSASSYFLLYCEISGSIFPQITLCPYLCNLRLHSRCGS